MEHLLGLALVYIVFIGALMSPGPDLLITMRNALGYSARAGIFTALGIAAGLVIHMSYCIAGIGLLISQSLFLFNLIKWVGAGYLIYIGIHAVRSKGTDPAKLKAETITKDLQNKTKSDRKAFVNGFVTNIFNPKATMFFLALFSQMLDPELPLELTISFCTLCILTAFSWFSTVSLVMAAKTVRQAYARASKWIDRIFGGFFIALGLKLALIKMH